VLGAKKIGWKERTLDENKDAENDLERGGAEELL